MLVLVIVVWRRHSQAAFMRVARMMCDALVHMMMCFTMRDRSAWNGKGGRSGKEGDYEA